MPSDNTNDIVISTRNLSKVYKLYRSPQDRLKEALHPGRKKYHKNFYALKDVNLEIRRGEVLGIVGKNGSGKSTLLKILSRVLTPSSGEFEVKGKVSSLLELGSGFNPELTGMENIFFYGTILGFTEEKIRGKLQEILDFAEIGDFVYQPLKTYSSGMKARLAFSVAINVDPDILILDEVLAVGDELFRRKCYARMEGFFKGGKTILFVSHSVQSVNQLCNRAIFVDNGELLLEGPAKLVTTQYERFIYAKKNNMPVIRKEIVLMNSEHKLKQATYNEIEQNKKNKTSVIYTDVAPVEAAAGKTITSSAASGTIASRACFIPDLTPKSRVEYRNEDVDIEDVCILNPDGEKVNILFTGEKYIYSYKVRFNIDAKDVVFGMMIKDQSGLQLSGASSFHLNKSIKHVKSSETYQVDWMFTCNYLKNIYFTNVAVSSRDKNKRYFLNRIVDAYVFKVKESDNYPFRGFVNIDQAVNIVRS
jgi:lipopolysaccharide transport system ATP-binding protein